MRASVWAEYEAEHQALEHSGYKADPLEWLASNWQGAAIGSLIARRPCKYCVCLVYVLCFCICQTSVNNFFHFIFTDNQTGVKLETLYQVGHSLTRVPADFDLHPDIQKLIVNRKKAMDTGKGTDTSIKICR